MKRTLTRKPARRRACAFHFGILSRKWNARLFDLQSLMRKCIFLNTKCVQLHACGQCHYTLYAFHVPCGTTRRRCSWKDVDCMATRDTSSDSHAEKWCGKKNDLWSLVIVAWVVLPSLRPLHTGTQFRNSFLLLYLPCDWTSSEWRKWTIVTVISL